MRITTLLCAACVLLAACGRGGSPTGPTSVGAPVPVVASLTSLTITASAHLSMLLIGSTQGLTANGIYSDGSTRTVSANWASSNPNVLSVSSTGQLTALSAGSASISASFGGRSATSSFRALPDFEGRWGAGFCNVSGVKSGHLLLSRSEGDRVYGSYNNGIGWVGPVTGQVSIDGTLTITGRIVSDRPTQRWTADLNEWRSRLSPSAGMTGNYREIMTLGGESLQGFASSEIIAATKSSLF
jgi:hypothetical protein